MRGDAPRAETRATKGGERLGMVSWAYPTLCFWLLFVCRCAHAIDAIAQGLEGGGARRLPGLASSSFARVATSDALCLRFALLFVQEVREVLSATTGQRWNFKKGKESHKQD